MFIPLWPMFFWLWKRGPTHNSFTTIGKRLLDEFNDIAKVIKSHIPTLNAPTMIVLPKKKPEAIDQSGSCLKRGRPIWSKDVAPHKIKGINQKVTLLESEPAAFIKESIP